MRRHLSLITTALVLSAAAALADPTGTFRVHANDTNALVVSQLRADLVAAERTIHRLLGEFPETVAVHVHPSRDAFTSALHEAWGMEETACWMVGATGERTLHLLSLDAWTKQACEHDPDRREHVRQLVTHEAVHVLHGQVNPSDDLGQLEELGWFTEGLATYGAGQLESRHAGRAVEAVAAGEAPDRLADAWTGPFRYGVSGSMVAFIDEAWGRDTLRSLLTATSQREILGALGVDEATFLERWRAWVGS